MTELRATLDALLALVPLESLPRTGWIQRGVATPESIAGHVLGTGFVALALAPRVEPPLDVDRVVSLCAVHDAPDRGATQRAFRDPDPIADELLDLFAKGVFV